MGMVRALESQGSTHDGRYTKGGDLVKPNRKFDLRLIGLILLAASVGLVGCKATPSPPTAAPTPPIRPPAGIEFEFAEKMQKVFFEFDKFRLLPEARATLEQNAAWLRGRPDIRVQIEGHCDERGTIEYNLGLGERRATSVRNYLTSLGVDSDRLFTISYGEERPVAMGHNEGAWAQNRRAEFKIAR
jgi:peptidoglycan-associated lipoprotein